MLSAMPCILLFVDSPNCRILHCFLSPKGTSDFFCIVPRIERHPLMKPHIWKVHLQFLKCFHMFISFVSRQLSRENNSSPATEKLGFGGFQLLKSRSHNGLKVHSMTEKQLNEQQSGKKETWVLFLTLSLISYATWGKSLHHSGSQLPQLKNEKDKLRTLPIRIL